MTEQDFERINSAIEGLASEQGIGLADPTNTFTVWLPEEWRRGVVE
jgi:hypothetical protein